MAVRLRRSRPNGACEPATIGRSDFARAPIEPGSSQWSMNIGTPSVTDSARRHPAGGPALSCTTISEQSTVCYPWANCGTVGKSAIYPIRRGYSR